MPLHIQQVKRSLDDVKQLASAKSLLSISLTTDIPGASSCNSGLEEWCEQNMGTDNDEWIDGGAMSLRVFDTRPSNTQPEPAILASLTAKSGTNVRWYSREKGKINEKRDLSIIDHLKTMNNRFEQHSIKSPVDPTALFRVNVKRSFTNNYNFIAESRVGEFHGTDSEINLRRNLILALEFLETNCSMKYGMFDSQVFAPNLSTLKETLENTDFLAVSSSTIDASCFHVPEFSSFLWDYELPKYSAKLGLSSGYYLLAKESDNMHLC
jgi:DNA phosphorothioation-dependent restriction protein DptH